MWLWPKDLCSPKTATTQRPQTESPWLAACPPQCKALQLLPSLGYKGVLQIWGPAKSTDSVEAVRWPDEETATCKELPKHALSSKCSACSLDSSPSQVLVYMIWLPPKSGHWVIPCNTYEAIILLMLQNKHTIIHPYCTLYDILHHYTDVILFCLISSFRFWSSWSIT